MNKPGSFMAAALLSATAACTPATKEPMPTVGGPIDDGAARADTLVVFLPGRGDRAEDFHAQGFFDIGHDGTFDMIAADAHMGYYRDRTFADRLHVDVMVPARERGYARIWLVGISAGGMGAMVYSRQHPDGVDGIVLLAPFLGERKLVDAIAAAGGPAQWSGESEHGEPYQRRTWRWLSGVTDERGEPPIVLAYGRDDRFASAADLLAGRLPPERVLTVDGGHDWPTWQRLWRRIVANGLPHGR